jgi:hypothetical protein
MAPCVGRRRGGGRAAASPGAAPCGLSAASVIRVYGIGAPSVSFEGRIHFSDAATRIDISNTTLITPESSTPPKALVFGRF